MKTYLMTRTTVRREVFVVEISDDADRDQAKETLAKFKDTHVLGHAGEGIGIQRAMQNVVTKLKRKRVTPLKAAKVRRARTWREMQARVTV